MRPEPKFTMSELTERQKILFNAIGDWAGDRDWIRGEWLAQNIKPLNQCDGCRRGLPLRRGIHYNPDGSYDFIGCSAKLYESVV